MTFFFFLHYTSAVKMINTKVAHALCSNFGVGQVFSIPKDNITYTYILILVSNLPLLLKTFFTKAHFQKNIFV